MAAYSSYASRSEPQPAAAVPVNVVELETELEAVRKQLAAVERRLAATERRLAMAERRRQPVTGDDEADAADVDDGDAPTLEPESERETTPTFVEFEIAEPGLDIRQNDNGSLSVRNSNPALAGEVVLVKAQGEDGRVYDLPITVPPVE